MPEVALQGPETMMPTAEGGHVELPKELRDVRDKVHELVGQDLNKVDLGGHA